LGKAGNSNPAWLGYRLWRGWPAEAGLEAQRPKPHAIGYKMAPINVRRQATHAEGM
jgi:hypothetical protein